MSERTVKAIRRHKLPRGVRWGAQGIIEATVEGQRMIVGQLTHDRIDQRTRRAFSEVRFPLDVKDDMIGKIIDAGAVTLAALSRV